MSDEVYHPIYHGTRTTSAARLPHATVIHDLSKAFSIAGVRTGWMIEHDAKRRQQYWTARAYFSVCNSTTGEILAEIAIRKRDVILTKTQAASTRNLRLLNTFMDEHREVLGWIPPRGGMTAFPWLRSGEDARPFCQAAAERGILLAPGDCFDVPSHFRLGLRRSEREFPQALSRFGRLGEELVVQISYGVTVSRIKPFSLYGLLSLLVDPHNHWSFRGFPPWNPFRETRTDGTLSCSVGF